MCGGKKLCQIKTHRNMEALSKTKGDCWSHSVSTSASVVSSPECSIVETEASGSEEVATVK